MRAYSNMYRTYQGKNGRVDQSGKDVNYILIEPGGVRNEIYDKYFTINQASNAFRKRVAELKERDEQDEK